MELIDLIQCIDKGLERFGSGGRQRIYWSVLTKSGLPFERLVSNPELFAETIQEILGEDASEVVELSIVKEIKKAFGLKYPSGSYSLVEAMKIALKKVVLVPETILVPAYV